VRGGDCLVVAPLIIAGEFTSAGDLVHPSLTVWSLARPDEKVILTAASVKEMERQWHALLDLHWQQHKDCVRGDCREVQDQSGIVLRKEKGRGKSDG